jgi:hypothetical protein
MNIFFTLKDFEFDINDNTFFEGANISDGIMMMILIRELILFFMLTGIKTLNRSRFQLVSQIISWSLAD